MNARERRVQQALDEKRRRRIAALMGDDVDESGPGAPEVEMRQERVMRGVTLTWLQHVFHRDRITAKQLLQPCPVMGSTPGGGAVYDIAEAAQYLVKPKLDVKRLLGTLREADLPDDLKPKIWHARRLKQAWMERAGHLWDEDKVIATFSEIFKRYKETTQLWADNIADKKGLPDDVRSLLMAEVDKLQEDMHKTIQDLAKSQRTPSQAEQFEDEEEPENDE